ncbi:MAG TPA: LLM class flavin-dependent oxidoreductase [Candidatus Nitrosocosmicus sp.]|jgi:alkanesulfonate monooxygenase|nr:LLM class flavin-dependent oxidoreductase [Candidatus Nitrosocosmicus sp.]
MPIELIGMIGVRPEGADGAAVHVIGGEIDAAWVRDFSRAHEHAGFDKVLVGYTSTAADGFLVAGHAAAHTERLGYLIAHRPGFVSPTLAARKAATLDQFTGGRVSLHIITGGSDADQAKDGDWLDHDTRYRRTDEYLTLLRRTWTEERPFDHKGEFYHVANAFSEIKPVQKPHIPLYFGGASEAAHAIGAKHCDVYMLWGEPLAAIRQRILEVRAAGARAGREPRVSVSLRPIIAATEDAAWDKAHRILATVRAKQGDRTLPLPEAVGAQRLVEFARQGELHDKRLWTPIAAAVGGAGNTTALVGTPPQVAESLLDYYDLGVSTLLIRGFDPLKDAEEYGHELIPLVRAGVARRDRDRAAA